MSSFNVASRTMSLRVDLSFLRSFMIDTSWRTDTCFNALWVKKRASFFASCAGSSSFTISIMLSFLCPSDSGVVDFTAFVLGTVDFPSVVGKVPSAVSWTLDGVGLVDEEDT